eukprot:Rhum_TRINITY_DN5911_c0_g1::Rhum_TRINITY_DN5911_c0_g1_i1::g.18717::m.18717/K18168/SDHAF2, SDH5; succinate dehydrogenase assembly factor 2
MFRHLSTRRWCTTATAAAASAAAASTPKNFQSNAARGLDRSSLESGKDWDKVEEVEITEGMMPPPAAKSFEVDIEIARKRLIYQSGKRGMLEMDALLGGFGKEAVPNMTRAELMEWHDVLRQYDIDLYAWLVKKTGLEDMPQSLKDSKVFADLIAYTNDTDKRRFEAIQGNCFD